MEQHLDDTSRARRHRDDTAGAQRHRDDTAGAQRHRDERGEGVISTAIAVLIVALLGVALWAGFSEVMTDATDRTGQQIQSIDGGP